MGHGPVPLLPPSRTKTAWDGEKERRFSRFPVFFSLTAAFFSLTNRPV